MTRDDLVPIEAGFGGNPRRQILVLHGGGYRGLFTASVLDHLQKGLNQPILDAFDMIAGTSVGGIIALGLANGIPPGEIRERIEVKGPDLFPHYNCLGRIRQFARRLFAAPHSQSKLKELVEAVLPAQDSLDDLPVHIVVPACDVTGSARGPEPVIFTNHHNDPLKTKRQVDVALATSAAPTYFPSYRLPLSTSELVDGGVIANSPSWIALTAAIARFGWKADSIRMVVVGTTTSPQGRVPSQPVTSRRKRAPLPFRQGQGYWYWLHKHRLLNLLMNGQQRLADEMSRQALEPGHFWAINSFRSPEQDKVAKSLDQASVAATGTLKSLAKAAADEACQDPRLQQVLNFSAMQTASIST